MASKLMDGVFLGMNFGFAVLNFRSFFYTEGFTAFMCFLIGSLNFLVATFILTKMRASNNV